MYGYLLSGICHDLHTVGFVLYQQYSSRYKISSYKFECSRMDIFLKHACIIFNLR